MDICQRTLSVLCELRGTDNVQGQISISRTQLVPISFL